MAQINSARVFNEIVTPFRWYDNHLKRNEYKRNCKNNCDYRLITPQHYMLPFMIVRDVIPSSTFVWKLIPKDGGSPITLDNSLIKRKTLLTKEYIYYDGDRFNFLMDCGFYYSELSDDSGTWYSELFYVTPSIYCDDIAVNGSFINNLLGWTYSNGVTWSAGNATLGAGPTPQNIYQLFTPNAFVKVVITATIPSGPQTVHVKFDVAANQDFSSSGTYTFYGNTGASGKIDVILPGDAIASVSIQSIQVLDLSDTSLECSVMFEWGSDCDFGNIYYRGGFKNRFFVDPLALIGEPTYRITQTTTDDGNEDKTPQFKKRQKVYQIETGFVPEYVVDALVDFQLHPIRKVCLNNCGILQEISEVTISSKPEFDGCYSHVKINFVIDEIVETGCCGNMNNCLQACANAIHEATLIESCEFEANVDLSGYDNLVDHWSTVKYDGAYHAIPGAVGFDLDNAVALQAALNTMSIGVCACSYSAPIMTITIDTANPAPLDITHIQIGVQSPPGTVDFVFIKTCVDSPPCTNGLTYIYNNEGTLKYCDDGTLRDVVCESGLVSNNDLDGNPLVPPYYLYDVENDIWLPTPAIFDIVENNPNDYTIFCTLVPGTFGQLYIQANCSGGFTATTGALLTADQWKNEGFRMPIANGKWCFKVSSYNDDCNYGYSDILEITVV